MHLEGKNVDVTKRLTNEHPSKSKFAKNKAKPDNTSLHWIFCVSENKIIMTHPIYPSRSTTTHSFS